MKTMLAWIGLSASSLMAMSQAAEVRELREERVGVLGARCLDLDGKLHRLGTEGRPRSVVVVFLEPQCPIARRYVPELSELYRLASEAEIEFFAVLSDPELAPSEALAFRQEYAIEYPILFDANGELASLLEPTHVPESFVVDARDRVIYRGRIDDRFAAVGRLRNRIRHHDLRDVVQALAREEAVEPRRTEAVGCVFEAWDQTVLETVDYHRDVAPILATHCLDCHYQGGVGPFELEDYDDARRRAKMIAYVARERLMPPWRAAEGHGHFRDERILSENQIEVLEAWARAGAPEGDSTEPAPLPEPPEAGWRRGEPDLVLTMPAAFEVPAQGEDIYRYFVIPNPSELEQDRVLTAMDFRPGDPSVVHHCLYYVDYSGRMLKKERSDPEPGIPFGEAGGLGDLLGMEALGGWAPGAGPFELPEDTGLLLEGGGDIVLEVHYHLNGKRTTDQSSLGLYYVKKPVQHYASGFVAGTESIVIPPGEADYWRRVQMDLPAEMTLIGIAPHMHYLGTEVRVSAILPDGQRESLIRIDDWDFRWQNTYNYFEPVVLPAGSRIEAWFRFDNTAENPANPHDPPREVRWGLQTTDEMCELYLTTIAGTEEEEAALEQAQYLSWIRSSEARGEPPQ